MISFVLAAIFSVRPSPIVDLKVMDNPNDEGGQIVLKWEYRKDADLSQISYIQIMRIDKMGTAPIVAEELKPTAKRYMDTDLKNGHPYRYFIRVWFKDGSYIDSAISPPVAPKAQWLDKERIAALIILLLYGALLIHYLKKARKGERLTIRPIAGLQAVDDAVGRATEMGRPLLFVLGLGTVSDIATLAGLAILKRVAMKAAEYESDIIVPCFDPVVMAAAQETVKQGYLEAGRPDLYNEKNVYFLTNDQFGYAAGIDGIIMRQKPGAIFLQGAFYAESLIIAETGHSIGAIQIAGTSSVTQLPFLIAATDYTLIGEEMYAASAYLSRDPNSLATIKAEDWMKIIFIGLILVGAALETVAGLTGDKSWSFIKTFFAGGAQ